MLRRVQRYNQSIESLECRIMLSAAVAQVSNGLTHTQLLGLYAEGKSELNQAANGLMGNVDANLRSLYSMNPTGINVSTQQFGAIESNNGKPGIALHVNGDVSSFLPKLEKLGITVLAVNPATHMIDGYLPISSLALAAKLNGVSEISALAKDTVHSVGSAVDQGESVEDVATARSDFSVDGTGVKVGVISDSANEVGNGVADSVASGDLPPNVTVIHDGSAGDTDEGRAMMEEIHDMAPGAQLYFYSGDGAQDAMVTAINALKAAGCKIIVDDLGYTDEPMFQDGVISKAINTFVTSGGSYFSAIGNDGDSGYLHTNTQYTTSNGQTFVNWAGNNSVSGETLTFTVADPVDITLQWDEEYNGDTGKANADLDVFVYKGATLVTESTDDNIASGIPEENLDTLDPGTYQMKVQLAALASGAAPDMIKFVAAEEGGNGVSAIQYTGPTGLRSSAYGHGAGQNTISVGAVEFASAPPFSSPKTVDSESFSSTGPIIYAYDVNGNKLATPLTLDKPDVSGVDGINTSFFGDVMADDPTNLPQFYGTSAAAPNVAAIAALIDQFKPGTTQAQILAALKGSTTPLNGAAAGAWDPQGGFGLVNAEKTLSFFGTVSAAPTVSLAAVSSPRATSLTSETITFSEAVAGFSLSNLSLTLNGGPNLLTTAQTLTSSNQTTFTLSNLSSLTSTAGNYKLTLSPTGITGAGLALAAGAAVSWVNNSAVAPTVNLTPVNSPRTTAVINESINFSEAVAGFKLSNLSLTLNGGANLLTSTQTLTTSDQTTFLLNNLSTLTAGVGTYVLTLSPSGITGSGLALAAGAMISWQVNGSNASPTIVLAPVNTPRSTPLASELITFNEPMTGLTVGSFSLSRSLGTNLMTSGQTLTTTDNVTFTLGNLSGLTAVAGSYVLTLDPTGIRGTGGNLNAGASISWQMSTTVTITPTVALTPVTTPRTSSIASENIVFNEPVAGFTLANLSLTLNGGANLLTSGQTLTSSDQTTFTLTNLAAITTTTGTYTLTLSPTGVTGGGTSMSAGANISWTTNPVGVAPTVTLASIASPTSSSIPSEKITFSQAITGFALAGLTLTRNGGSNLLTSSQSLTSPDQTVFTLNNLASLTSTPGNYVLTLSKTGITGAGLPLASGASVSWTNSSSTVGTPTVSIANATVTKPASGTTLMNFLVTLSAAGTSAITISYATVAGTASSGSGDYVGVPAGVLTIPAGQTSGTIAIAIKGNTQKNSPRAFTVHINGVTGATLSGTGIATGTILSGTTAQPTVTFPTTTAFKASTTQTTVLSIAVTLTSAATSTITIDYATVAGTASSGGGDYIGIPNGVLTIAAGQTTGHILISIKPHPATTNKSFSVTLTGATNATLVNKVDKVTLT